MIIRDVLNKIKWDTKEIPEQYVITFIHRGIPGNKRTIKYDFIDKINKDSFIYTSPEGIETVIPFHRILEIRNTATDVLLYEKKGKKQL